MSVTNFEATHHFILHKNNTTVLEDMTAPFAGKKLLLCKLEDKLFVVTTEGSPLHTDILQILRKNDTPEARRRAQLFLRNLIAIEPDGLIDCLLNYFNIPVGTKMDAQVMEDRIRFRIAQ